MRETELSPAQLTQARVIGVLFVHMQQRLVDAINAGQDEQQCMDSIVWPLFHGLPQHARMPYGGPAYTAYGTREAQLGAVLLDVGQCLVRELAVAEQRGVSAGLQYQTIVLPSLTTLRATLAIVQEGWPE